MLRNLGGGSFSSPETIPVSTRTLVKLADVDGDLDLDIVAASSLTSTVMVFFNSGAGLYGLPTTYFLNSPSYEMLATDLDGDNRPELVLSQYNSSVAIMQNSGFGSYFDAFYVSSSGSRPQALAAADLDLDAAPELAVTNYYYNTIGLLDDNNQGYPLLDLIPSGGSAPTGIVLADLDNDGDQDMAVCHYNSANVGVLLNQVGQGISLGFSTGASSHGEDSGTINVDVQLVTSDGQPSA